MRVPIVLLTGLALAFPPSLQAQRSTSDLIVQAFQLWSTGQPKAAIAMLEPTLRAGVNGAAESELGVGWNTLADLKLRRFTGCTIDASGFR